MELFRTLGALIEPPGPELRPLADALELGPFPAEAEHTELFLFQLYPYASVYLGAEGMLGGEPRDRIAGFWRALGQAPPDEPDHLTVMLAFYAALREQSAAACDPVSRARGLQARKAYLWEHLLSWLPAFLAMLGLHAPPFYRRWGQLLHQALAGELETVGRQERLALHLREAPGIADPRELGLDAFLDSLLSPVRSGIILVRGDLSRAARQLGLGSRIGERKFVLKALLGQQPAAILDWLAEHSTGWAERHRRQQELWGSPVEFWGRAGRKHGGSGVPAEVRLMSPAPRIGGRESSSSPIPMSSPAPTTSTSMEPKFVHSKRSMCHFLANPSYLTTSEGATCRPPRAWKWPTFGEQTMFIRDSAEDLACNLQIID